MQGERYSYDLMTYYSAWTSPQLTYLFVVLALLLSVLFVLGLALGLRLGRRSGRSEAERAMPDRLAVEREDAVRRSRAVLGGQMAEQLAPYLPGFPFDPTEIRFIGKPIDFIAFRGVAGGTIEEVAFVEVKSGASALSKVERSLRDAIESGRVSWVESRAP